MAKRLIAGAALFSGLALLAYAALQGDVSVHLVVVVPVVTGTGPWAALGGLLTVAGLAGWVWTGLAGAGPGPRGTPPPGGEAHAEEGPSGEQEASTRGGGVLLIGPIPVAWGTDARSLTGVLLAAAALLLVALAAVWLLR